MKIPSEILLVHYREKNTDLEGNGFGSLSEPTGPLLAVDLLFISSSFFLQTKDTTARFIGLL